MRITDTDIIKHYPYVKGYDVWDSSFEGDCEYGFVIYNPHPSVKSTILRVHFNYAVTPQLYDVLTGRVVFGCWGNDYDIGDITPNMEPNDRIMRQDLCGRPVLRDNVTRLEFCKKMREYLTQLVPDKNTLSEYIDVFCNLRLPPLLKQPF